MVYYLLIFILMTSGLFAMATQLAGFPPASTAKGIKLAVREDKGFMDFVNTYFIMPFVKVLAPFIHIAPFKEKRMALRLARAEIKFTPKEYMARSVLMSASTGAVAFLLLTFTMSSLSFLGIVIGVVVFFHFNGEVNDKLKEKDTDRSGASEVHSRNSSGTENRKGYYKASGNISDYIGRRT